MAQVVSSILTLENEVFRSYLFYSSILILKMMFMSTFTGLTRIKNKAFANPEDSKAFHAKPKTDESVERIRRAHLNDIENIPLFLIVGIFYVLTNPTAVIAKILFMFYTAARVSHTFVYVVCPLPQPARGLSWIIGFLITGFMAVKTLLYFW